MILSNWRYTLPVTLAVAFGSILVFYVPPLVIAELIRRDTSSLESAWPLVLLFGAAWLAGEMMWRVALFIMIKLELKVIRKLYDDAFTMLTQKELSFYSNRFTGSITKNVLAFARRFESFYDTITFEIISQIFPAIFAAIVLAFISPWLSVALFTMLGLGTIMVIPLIKRRVKLVKDREEAHAAMSGHISDVIANIAAIKSFGAEGNERDLHHHYANNFLKSAGRSWFYQNNRIDMVISPIYVATNVLGLAIVLSLGVDPETKAGLFLAFSYFANITRFLWSFNNVYRRLEESITDASLFVDYTIIPPSITDAPGAKKLALKNGEVSFNTVDFTHNENSDTLFRDFTLTIPAGQKLGLVGHSGAGKSTIVNLLLRFMDIDGGTITIDGQDISKVTQESLHKSIAYVPQEPLLFHRSLRDNIAYGKQQATEADIVDAARKAHALEFIEKLPQGFDTLVGERGVKLSGGQRQRVAIARAILKDAPLLVLDEATSALDSESEKLIQASLGSLMKGRTSIVIAHRLSTIAKLDRIVVMENGVIAEDGSHAELLKLDGTYARLWKHQSGGFIDD